MTSLRLYSAFYCGLFSFSVCTPPNPLMVPSDSDFIEAYLLPHVIIWNPLIQFQSFFKGNVPRCPKYGCKECISFSRWNLGQSCGRGPRLLHELHHIILLLPAVYVCGNGHETISTDLYILTLIPEQEYIPFILFHRCGVTRQFARAIIALGVGGMSFTAIEHFVASRRGDYIASLQLQMNYITKFRDTVLLTCSSIKHLCQPYPSNDLITNCFAENRDIYTHAMASLGTSAFISIDHTFKVTANLGYLRHWISLYNSLFIVLNNVGQVLAWKFTQTTSIDEAANLLQSLFMRLQRSSSPCQAIYVDNCCVS